MWCPNCQADVAAEVSPDTRQARCAACGGLLETPHTARSSARTREARELLERWASGSLFDPYGAGSARAASATSAPAPTESTPIGAAESAGPTELAAPPAAPRRSFRIDTPHAAGTSRPLADGAARADGDSTPTAPITRPEPITKADSIDTPVPRVVTRRRPTARPLDPPPEPLAVAPTAATRARAETRPAPPVAVPIEPTAPAVAASSGVAPVRAHRPPAQESLFETASDFAASDLDAARAPRESVAMNAGAGLERSQDAVGRIPPILRFDPPHAAIPAPHVSAERFVEPARRANTTSLAGQFLAYAGVLGLTIGTAMVLWGYFGGPEHFTPTGWLITTVGQMLLFLGVVTLVSGGMEQTTDEVARRIDHLGERLLRIEQASRDGAPRGPTVPTDAESRGTSRRAV